MQEALETIQAGIWHTSRGLQKPSQSRGYSSVVEGLPSMCKALVYSSDCVRPSVVYPRQPKSKQAFAYPTELQTFSWPSFFLLIKLYLHTEREIQAPETTRAPISLKPASLGHTQNLSHYFSHQGGCQNSFPLLDCSQEPDDQHQTIPLAPVILCSSLGCSAVCPPNTQKKYCVDRERITII